MSVVNLNIPYFCLFSAPCFTPGSYTGVRPVVVPLSSRHLRPLLPLSSALSAFVACVSSLTSLT